MSDMKLDAYSIVTMAAVAAMEIQNLGYSAGQVPSKAQIDKLDDFVDKINKSVETDFDNASILFGAYRQQLGSITSQADEIKTKLSDIEVIGEKIRKPREEKPKTWSFTSSDGTGKYQVRMTPYGLKCNCMGAIRSKQNCKHIKQVNK